MPRPGTTQPDLVSELREMRTRLDALERKPIPQSIFDKYPAVEWAAVPRGPVAGNEWSSVSVSNVTGLKYDRIECKFITFNIVAARSEAEVRLAAFRHAYDSSLKECVSATSTVRLTGNTANTISVAKFRWIHGIQFGWDYTDDDSAIYTIELQHRNPNDLPARADDYRQVYGFSKLSKTTAPEGGALAMPNNTDFATAVVSQTRPGVGLGWWRIGDDAWDGRYSISQMHYCVGMSQERLPTASTSGWFWNVGGGARFVRDPNINEPYFNV